MGIHMLKSTNYLNSSPWTGYLNRLRYRLNLNLKWTHIPFPTDVSCREEGIHNHGIKNTVEVIGPHSSHDDNRLLQPRRLGYLEPGDSPLVDTRLGSRDWPRRRCQREPWPRDGDGKCEVWWALGIWGRVGQKEEETKHIGGGELNGGRRESMSGSPEIYSGRWFRCGEGLQENLLQSGEGKGRNGLGSGSNMEAGGSTAAEALPSRADDQACTFTNRKSSEIKRA